MANLFSLPVIAFFLSTLAFGQTYTISTAAGGGLPANIPGSSAKLIGSGLFAFLSLQRNLLVAVTDESGNIYIADKTYNVVLRLDATSGILSLVAGNGTQGFSGDNGPATSAQLNNPDGLAVDTAGNLYIGDALNYRVRKVSNGIITTVAGTGTPGISGDNGPAINAQISTANSLLLEVAVDGMGNLYIGEEFNKRVRKVSNGVITTVAGNGTQGFSGDNGPATSAQLSGPAGIAVGSAGELYIADNARIRKVSNGVITTVAGNGTQGYSGDNGPATSAQIIAVGVATDSGGNFYIADQARIRKVSNGVITTVAGNGTQGVSGDNGPATSAQLGSLRSVTADGLGNIYIAEYSSGRIRKVSNGVITTVAGGGSFIGENGPATSADLLFTLGVAVDSAGSLYIADSENNLVRKVSNGVITTVAGNGTQGFSGDNGAATSAKLSGPAGVAVDLNGNLYIVDSNNRRIRKVSNGMITTVAGGGSSLGDNGPATSAQLSFPLGVATDSAGNLYIADTFQNRIRKVSNSVITTVAGGGSALGDNGPATSAQLSTPYGVALDASGNLYIADTGNRRVRRVSGGVITTIAGTGTAAFSGDNGPAVSAQLLGPAGIATDAEGNIYISDADFFGDDPFNSRIRKISNGVITTIAGGGLALGDNNPATNAQVAYPQGITIDSAGKVYIADTGNGRIRVLTPSCTYSVSSNSLQVSAMGGSFPITIQTVAGCAWSVTGLPTWITIAGPSAGNGPAIVTVMIAANTGSTLGSTISVAGISVAINQAAGPNAGCGYKISPGGQAFPAAGGVGTIAVTANPGCTWIATSNVAWVTINGANGGAGNGTVVYQVAANAGAALSGTINIAGLTFALEQSASTFLSTSTTSLPHLAVAGSWETTITLVNTGLSTAQVRLNFFDDNGNPLTLPLTFPRTSVGPLLAATLDQTINAGAQLVVKSTGPGAVPIVGWAQLLTNGSVSGVANFDSNTGATDQQVGLAFEARNANAYIFPFDDTSNNVTAVALANTSAQPGNVGITIRDDTGAMVFSSTIAMAGHAHTAFVLPNSYGFTDGIRGTLEFDAPNGGQISTLGLLFNNKTRAFGNIAVLTK